MSIESPNIQGPPSLDIPRSAEEIKTPAEAFRILSEAMQVTNDAVRHELDMHPTDDSGEALTAAINGGRVPPVASLTGVRSAPPLFRVFKGAVTPDTYAPMLGPQFLTPGRNAIEDPDTGEWHTFDDFPLGTTYSAISEEASTGYRWGASIHQLKD